jgi:hypothetical protein
MFLFDFREQRDRIAKLATYVDDAVASASTATTSNTATHRALLDISDDGYVTCDDIARSSSTLDTDATTAAALGDQMVSCGVCFDDVASSDTFSLACKHSFCIECWSHMLVTY